MIGETHSTVSLADRFDARALVRLVWRHADVLAVSTALGLGGGFLFSAMQTPDYTAKARIEVAPKATKVLSDLSLTEAGSTVRLTATARERLRSKPLAMRVAADLALDQNDDFLAPDSGHPLFGNYRGIKSNATIEELLRRTSEERIERAAALVRAGITVQQVRNTPMLAISFDHPRAELAAAVANGVVTSYISTELERRLATSLEAKAFLEKQIGEAERELKAAETELVRYADLERLTIGEDGKPVPDTGAASLRNALAQAKGVRVRAERMSDQLLREGVETLPQAFSNNNIQQLKSLISAQRAEYAMKRERMKPDFPAMLALAARIAEFEERLENEFQAVSQAVIADVKQAADQVESLKGEIAEVEAGQRNTLRLSIGHSIRKRKVEAERTRYATLARKLSEITVSAALVEPGVAVVELATVPTSPSGTNPLFFLLGGLALFGTLGAGVIVTREVLRDRFETPADVARTLSTNILGTLPRVRLGRFATAEERPHSDLREAFRFLRTTLQSGPLASDGQVLLVASTARGEGRTSVAKRLSKDFAKLGRNVLIIDGDLSSPRLAEAFGVDNGSGLSTLLDWRKGSTDVSGCFHDLGENLTVLTAGPADDASSDRLASPRLPAVLKLLRKSFDVIVIDGAPIMSRADAVALAHVADRVVMVVAADRVNRSDAIVAMSRLRDVGADISGVVLNRHRGKATFAVNPGEGHVADQVRRELMQRMGAGRGAGNPVHDMLAEAASAMGAAPARSDPAPAGLGEGRGSEEQAYAQRQAAAG